MPFVDGGTDATNEGRRDRTDSSATPPLPFLIRIFGRTRQQSVGTSQRDGGFRRFALDRPLSRAALSARPSQVRGSRLRLCGVTTDAPAFPSRRFKTSPCVLASFWITWNNEEYAFLLAW